VWRETSRIGTELDTDRVIAGLAHGQWGVVARRQLMAEGVTERMIHRRLASGRLVPLYRGVYAVGHDRLRREGRWLAAVLAVPGSVLSHRDAAGLHGLRPANHREVDVTVARGAARQRGIRIHRTRVLDARDVTTVERIPVTTVARTLVDLAGMVPADHVSKVLREAERQQVLDVRAIDEVLARTRGRRGPGHERITDALAELAQLGTTLRSPLEVAFARLVRQAGLPKPHANARVAGMEVDAHWPADRLIVELDGWEHHRAREAFQRDRVRDRELMAAGHRVVRFTHDDVARRPDHVVETLRRLGIR